MLSNKDITTLECAGEVLSKLDVTEPDIRKAFVWLEDIIRRVNLKPIFQLCLDKWGIQSQLIQAMEESAELIQEITGVLRGRKGAFERLALEIADMEIMIGQLAHILEQAYVEAYEESNPGQYYDMIQSSKELKVSRLIQRLAGNGEEDVL